MSVYELIEKILADLNQAASAILGTAQNIAVLRDAMKAADKAAQEKKEEKDA